MQAENQNHIVSCARHIPEKIIITQYKDENHIIDESENWSPAEIKIIIKSIFKIHTIQDTCDSERIPFRVA